MHSCVAVAELLFAILSYESQSELSLEHTALDYHELRHTGCDECAAVVSVPNYKAARRVWDNATAA
eukprot:8980109-Heterocapsa_arctica.AAC.1